LKLLVTGGLGFIGSNFIRHVLATDPEARIANIDVMSYGSNPSNVSDLLPDKRYNFVRGDISNERILGPMVAKADCVVNFAAETHVDRSISSSQSFMRSNVLGVHTILEALRRDRRRTRFVQIGTDEEYGETAKGSFTEKDRLTPSSPYAATKASASMLVSAYARTYGLDVLIVRCTNNFGPHQFPEKLIPKTIIRATRNLPIPIYGSGKQVRDWIHVRDYCRALTQVMEHGRTGEIYNVSAGNEIDNLSIVRRILGIMHQDTSLIEHVKDRPGHDMRYSLDSSKLRKETKWKPQYSLEKALVSTVKWYLDNESWWRPIATPRVLSESPWKAKW
jgi:dTDP-glucose 4,6-dehydratase